MTASRRRKLRRIVSSEPKPHRCAIRLTGVRDYVQAIREGRLPKDSKLAALSALARTMIEKRGRLDDQDIDRFLATGFGKDHALEVVAIVAASTITNYTGSITKSSVSGSCLGALRTEGARNATASRGWLWISSPL